MRTPSFTRTFLRSLLLLWLLATAVWVPAAAAGDWPDPATLDEAVTEALNGKQIELVPRATEEADLQAPAAIALGGGMLGSFFELLSYVLLAAGVVLLITVILQRTGLLDRGVETEATVTDDVIEVTEAAVVRPPDAAVAAAARGEFGEALRLLLGEVLPRFYRGHGAGWPEAWTSRQCLRRVVPAEPAREPLAGLIGAVERHHFGGRPAGASDWESWARRADELQPSAPGEGAP